MIHFQFDIRGTSAALDAPIVIPLEEVPSNVQR
jgi:hypothetical protein